MADCRELPDVSVIDIACPACGETGSVRKERIGTYRCADCDHQFDHSDIDPLEQSEG